MAHSWTLPNPSPIPQLVVNGKPELEATPTTSIRPELQVANGAPGHHLQSTAGHGLEWMPAISRPSPSYSILPSHQLILAPLVTIPLIGNPVQSPPANHAMVVVQDEVRPSHPPHPPEGQALDTQAFFSMTLPPCAGPG